MSQIISAADLEYRRAIRELELATKACEAITKRTQERIETLKADTDARRARCVEIERQIGVYSPQDPR
jgi:vacuolar-type H+-ATPase subunit E/Vma4